MTKIVDFHSHILPGLDHGCRDLNQSLEQLALISASGTDTVAASSHFYPGTISLSDFLAKRSAAAELLRQSLPANAPKIVVGAEVYCRPGLENLAGIEALCLEGTRCLLLEMPLDKWTDSHFETVDSLSNDGFTVILAHIDRYPAKDVEVLMRLDVQAQVNASSLLSFLRRGKTKKWFEAGRVFALGSDLHGSEANGYSHFPKAMKILGAQKTEDVMARSEALLKDAVYLNDKNEKNRI